MIGERRSRGRRITLKNQNNVLYLIGSLRNERIPKLASQLRKTYPEVEVFDDWYSAGPEADDYWKTYEQARGRTYQEALEGYAAKHVFEFDRSHLNRCTHALLVLPAGKSGHMEIMYAAYGVGAKAAILLDPEDVRWDVMYQFVDVLDNDEAIGTWLGSERGYRDVCSDGKPGDIIRTEGRWGEGPNGASAFRAITRYLGSSDIRS